MQIFPVEKYKITKYYLIVNPSFPRNYEHYLSRIFSSGLGWWRVRECELQFSGIHSSGILYHSQSPPIWLSHYKIVGNPVQQIFNSFRYPGFSALAFDFFRKLSSLRKEKLFHFLSNLKYNESIDHLPRDF